MNRVLELTGDMPVKRVMEGETLMTQGGTELQIAVLKSGKVEVIKDGEQIAVIDEAGAVFGEMSVILQTSHTATVHVVETSEFYMIDDPQYFLWERAEFNFELLAILAARLEETDYRLADFKHRRGSSEIAFSIVESMLEEISQRESA